MFRKIKKMFRKNVVINLWNNDDRSGGFIKIGRYSINDGLDMMLTLKEKGYRFKVMNVKKAELNVEFY